MIKSMIFMYTGYSKDAPPYLKAAGKDAMEIYRTFSTF